MCKIAVEDLQTMLDKSLCIYKNKPYYIKQVGPNYQALCINLLTQREEYIPITSEDTFKAPTQRLGYVNVDGAVLYCTRTPVRRYKVGLSKDNFIVEKGQIVGGFEEGVMAATAKIQNLRSVELADCILGKYPTFEEAYAKCREGLAKSVAFDRQFAIVGASYLLYKNQQVGNITRKAGKPIIKWEAGYEYLETLLDGKYEKTVSTPR